MTKYLTSLAGLASLTLAVAGATAPRPALAFGDSDLPRYFNVEGKMSADGRKVVVSGNSDCRPNDGVVRVSATVMQVANSAGARGFSFEKRCTAELDTFTAEISVREGLPAFTAGPIQACALLRTANERGRVEFDHWCAFVNLVVDPAL